MRAKLIKKIKGGFSMKIINILTIALTMALLMVPISPIHTMNEDTKPPITTSHEENKVCHMCTFINSKYETYCQACDTLLKLTTRLADKQAATHLRTSIAATARIPQTHHQNDAKMCPSCNTLNYGTIRHHYGQEHFMPRYYCALCRTALPDHEEERKECADAPFISSCVNPRLENKRKPESDLTLVEPALQKRRPQVDLDAPFFYDSDPEIDPIEVSMKNENYSWDSFTPMLSSFGSDEAKIDISSSDPELDAAIALSLQDVEPMHAENLTLVAQQPSSHNDPDLDAAIALSLAAEAPQQLAAEVDTWFDNSSWVDGWNTL